jgi:hypothetical protein
VTNLVAVAGEIVAVSVNFEPKTLDEDDVERTMLVENWVLVSANLTRLSRPETDAVTE